MMLSQEFLKSTSANLMYSSIIFERAGDLYMDNDENILDTMTRVCICKGIPRSKIKAAIEKGAITVVQVGRLTGSGRGSCQGRRCTEPIKRLITDYREQRHKDSSTTQI